MATYKITAKTNGYIAQRDAMFKGRTEVTLESGLELKEAYKELLDLFNRKNDLNAPNWGIAVRLTRNQCDGARPTFQDGTRCFSYDSRTFWIEEEEC